MAITLLRNIAECGRNVDCCETIDLSDDQST